MRDLKQLEPNLRLYNNGRQLQAGEIGRLDILGVDEESLIVIELKAGRADDRVCGQILRYMGWVKENLAGDKKVRGIVVASEFTESLRFAAKAMPDVKLKTYTVSFQFKDEIERETIMSLNDNIDAFVN